MKTSVYIRDMHSTYTTHKIGKCPHFGKKKSTCIMRSLYYLNQANTLRSEWGVFWRGGGGRLEIVSVGFLLRSR